MARTIKKYANRRLYDTAASRHVTLEGIRQLVAGGEDVRVIDDTTGQDITRNILLQVITDQEQGGRPILSAETLKKIIRFYGNPLQEFLSNYLDHSIEVFLSQQRALQDQMQKTLGVTSFATLQTMASKNMEAWSQMQHSFFDLLRPRSGDRSTPTHPHEGGPGGPPAAKD